MAILSANYHLGWCLPDYFFDFLIRYNYYEQHHTQNRLDEECAQLLVDIRRIGVDGEPHTTFGELFDDETVANYYEALVGTLKAAKKRKMIDFKGQLLLKGVSDKVKISIVE